MKGIMEIMRIEKLYFDELNKIIQEYNQEYETVLASMTKCYRAHYNKLIFHFSGKIKEVLA